MGLSSLGAPSWAQDRLCLFPQFALGPPQSASSREPLSAQWAVNSCSGRHSPGPRQGQMRSATILSNQMRSGGLCEVNLRKNKQRDKTRELRIKRLSNR